MRTILPINVGWAFILPKGEHPAYKVSPFAGRCRHWPPITTREIL